MFQFICNKPLLRKSLTFIFSFKESRKLYESKTRACLENFWFTQLDIKFHRHLVSSTVHEIYGETGGWRELKTLFQYGGNPQLTNRILPNTWRLVENTN